MGRCKRLAAQIQRAVLLSVIVGGIFAYSFPAAAQPSSEASSTSSSSASGDDDDDDDGSMLNDQQSTESVPVTWSLYPTTEGVPTVFRTNVISSADITQLVVDVFIDGVLAYSVAEPEVIVVDLAQYDTNLEEVTLVTLVGRESGSTDCVVLDGVVSFSNVRVERRLKAATTFNDATLVSVTGDDEIAVANMAAAVEREMVLPEASVAVDAPVTVEVSPDSTGDTVQSTVLGLADVEQFSVNTETDVVAADLRTIQRHEINLERSGGSAFVSSTDFGGRVAEIELSGEINTTPLAEGGGFAVEVDGTVVTTGALDADGRASFTATVGDWPRDADVAVRLALREDREACSPGVVGFTGTADVELRPLPSDFGELTVRDFPQRLLEDESVTLWVDADVPTEWVAVAVAALQETSSEPLYFEGVRNKNDATVRLSLGPGEPSVVEGALELPLSDQMVEMLSVDRFWEIGLDEEQKVEVDIAAETVSVAPAGLETPRAGWITVAAVAAAAIAVLLLFRKNSHHAP